MRILRQKSIKDEDKSQKIVLKESFEAETRLLLKKLKRTLILIVIGIWTIYTILDIFIFHQGNLEKTVFTLDFHEFWTYLITAFFFISIYFFSHVFLKRQREVDRKILEAERKLSQFRRDLITRVSHELKTPLNAIYGATQMLLNFYKEELDATVIKYINGINKGSARLNLLIEDLIDSSKIEVKKLVLNKKKENIVEIIKETVEELIYLANKRGLFLNVDIPKEMYIEVDRIRIQQVITNLISNAIKNTPAKGNINIQLINNKDYVDLSINDSGVGITIEEKKELFKEFGKIERYGESLGIDIEGSGLGLYISKGIAELHGGKIEAKSEGRGKGSTFIVTLLKTQPVARVKEIGS